MSGSADAGVEKAGGNGRPPTDRLTSVVLTGESLTRLSPILEADRAQAVSDLEVENSFALCPSEDRVPPPGPYILHLSVQEGRLVFEVRDKGDALITTLGLALGPFRGLIKDYQLLVDSHIMAVEEGRAERIQAIDMGRRGLHNEGAALLQARLANKAVIDQETARRLFTLVCVLHTRI